MPNQKEGAPRERSAKGIRTDNSVPAGEADVKQVEESIEDFLASTLYDPDTGDTRTSPVGHMASEDWLARRHGPFERQTKVLRKLDRAVARLGRACGFAFFLAKHERDGWRYCLRLVASRARRVIRVQRELFRRPDFEPDGLLVDLAHRPEMLIPFQGNET